MEIIKAGIVGYGNLGKGTCAAIKNSKDIELQAIFTRRSPGSLAVSNENIKVESVDNAKNYKKKIDVMILCGGSATDLPVQGPKFARMFNTVDSYDNHQEIPEYYAQMDAVASENKNTALISIGWDPGLFSLNRLLGETVLPAGKGYTFWGPGVSQGHSDALRRIEGVKDAVQYTIPREKAISKVREGLHPDFNNGDRHLRECHVVLEEGADKVKIAQEIKQMPNYFADYDTEVNFVTQDELDEKHSGIPHGGFVLRSARTGDDSEHNQIVEFSLKLESNPEFTAQVLTAYARAVCRLHSRGHYGARTIFDVAPADLSPKKNAQLRKELL